MTVTKEAYVDLQEKYWKVMKLIKEVDPESTPYVSKYTAKQELITMKAGIEDLLRKNPDDESKEHLRLIGMLGAVYYYLGSLSVDVEEVTNAKRFLQKCKEVTEEYRSSSEVVQVGQLMYNQLAILTAENEPQESLNFITEAQKLYESFKETRKIPLDVSDLFAGKTEGYDVDKGVKNFEKNFTLTLYYLAQIHGALKNTLKSSIYCHITLQRQLEHNDYDPIDWALNAATLSQVFMERNGFKQARHHLAASSYVLDKYEQTLNRLTDYTEENDAKIENFKHRSADIARCWSKYGLMLLCLSKDRLLQRADDMSGNSSLCTDMSKLGLNSDDTSCVEDVSTLNFPTLPLATYENEITDSYLLTLQDARKVFLSVQRWLNKAHEYYTFNSLASDYIEITQDKSQMHAHLAFFEDNPDNQAKLHKRRADLLENIIREVNPTYYLHYCRQIYFELAQIYTDILDIKIDKVQQLKDRPSPHTLQKINTLVDKAVQNYTNFINTFKTLSDEPGEAVPVDFEKPFLLAHFHTGALYRRYVAPDKRVKIKHDQSSLASYKKVVEYCKANPKAADLIPQELSICKQMVELLPLRIASVV